MAQSWTSAERHLAEVCRAAARDGEALAPEQAAALLELVRAIHDRAHSDESTPLDKSGALSTTLRLVGDERLYTSRLILKRVELLTHVLARCVQRPLLEIAALSLLSMELRHGWASDAARVEQVAQAVSRSKVKTLAAYALSAHLRLPGAQEVARGFGELSLDGRRARIGELTGMLSTYGEEPGIEALVSTTFEALFRGLEAAGKTALVDRLFREMKERSGRGKPVRWELLLDPLLSQNIADELLQRRVLGLLGVLDSRHGEVYALLHLRHARPEGVDPAALSFLIEHGTRAALPVLGALWQQLPETFFLFDQHASLRREVKRVQDAIIEREGVQAGALTLAEGEGGGLSLAASFGELSLTGPAEASTALTVQEPARQPWWRRLACWLGGLFGAAR